MIQYIYIFLFIYQRGDEVISSPSEQMKRYYCILLKKYVVNNRLQ